MQWIVVIKTFTFSISFLAIKKGSEGHCVMKNLNQVPFLGPFFIHGSYELNI